MGKAYANKRCKENRPQRDAYPIPKSLVWVALSIIKNEFDKNKLILEPCCGEGAISEELIKLGYNVTKSDLYVNGVDYLLSSPFETQVITNSPFYLWDAFLRKAKSHADKIMFIGRLNYFGTHGRNRDGIWQNLKHVYCFDRYVDYQTPYRKDGMFHVGAMATACFLFEREYRELSKLSVLDVQKYATLGGYKNGKDTGGN